MHSGVQLLDWNVVRTFTRWVNCTPVGPQFAAFLALLSTRLPGLVPVLPVSANRAPQTSGTYTGRILQAAHRRSAALWKAVAAIGVAGIMVSAAFAGMPALVHRSVPSGGTVLGNNSSPPFFPYLVPGSDYPAPVNLSLGGNVSLPQMDVTSTAGIPSYHLLAITQNNGTYSPVLITGSYSVEYNNYFPGGSRGVENVERT